MSQSYNSYNPYAGCSYQPLRRDLDDPYLNFQKIRTGSAKAPVRLVEKKQIIVQPATRKDTKAEAAAHIPVRTKSSKLKKLKPQPLAKLKPGTSEYYNALLQRLKNKGTVV